MLQKRRWFPVFVMIGLALSIGAGLEYRAFASTHHVIFTNVGIRPSTITVNRGDTVKIEIRNNANQTHNFVIPDYSVFSQNLQPGATTSIEFEADKAGKFPYYSDFSPSGVYGKPESGYKGILIVQ